jgi:hypothetical protein
MKEKIEETIRVNGEGTKPPEDVATKLRIVIDSVHAVVRAQAEARKLLELDDSAVPAKLRDYATSKTLSKVQTLLFEETIRSLESGTYRSAIVMGWNLIYDGAEQGFRASFERNDGATGAAGRGAVRWVRTTAPLGAL